MSKTKYGNKLVVGNTIEVWWSSNTVKPRQDTIVEIQHISAAEKTWPSYQKMMKLFPKGYAFAKFLSGVRMTIDFNDVYEVMS